MMLIYFNVIYRLKNETLPRIIEILPLIHEAFGYLNEILPLIQATLPLFHEAFGLIHEAFGF